MNEADEVELEALMRQRRMSDARLNRALGELLGTGDGAAEALLALEEVEGVLRSLAALVNPRTSPPMRKIVPAPRNPIPVTICAAMRLLSWPGNALRGTRCGHGNGERRGSRICSAPGSIRSST